MGSKQHLPYANWTAADHALILRESDAGLTSKQIWEKHFPDRAKSSVEKRLTVVRKARNAAPILRGYEGKAWTAEEIDLIRRGVVEEKLSHDQIRVRFLPHRTTAAIKCKAQKSQIYIREARVGETEWNRTPEETRSPLPVARGSTPAETGSRALLRALIRYAVRHHPESDLARLAA